jgi:hypothetical protein
LEIILFTVGLAGTVLQQVFWCFSTYTASFFDGLSIGRDGVFQENLELSSGKIPAVLKMKTEIHVNKNRDFTSDLMKFNVQVEAALSIQLESRNEVVVWKKI